MSIVGFPLILDFRIFSMSENMIKHVVLSYYELFALDHIAPLILFLLYVI